VKDDTGIEVDLLGLEFWLKDCGIHSYLKWKLIFRIERVSLAYKYAF
jgi:hypothetical protein